MAAGVDNLPILEHEKKILRHIRNHRITCIHGETGCGKSTMVPQFILDHHERMRRRTLRSRQPVSTEDNVNIMVTQPRRVAAISLAKRVAKQRGELVGETVGYRIGGDSKTCDGTKICFVTTGLLLQMFTNNPECFRKYTHIILDEIHERQIDCDLLSLVVKLLVNDSNYPDNKIIIMSATLEGRLFSRYFDMNPSSQSESSEEEEEEGTGSDVIFVGAKRYDVTQVYLDELVTESHYKDCLGADGVRAATLAYIKFNRQKPACKTNKHASIYASHFMQINYSESLAIGATMYVEAKKDIDLLKKGLPAKFPMKPDICEGLNHVCIQLIKHLMMPGETILVFLPGVGEIQMLHDELAALERHARRCRCLFRLFTLSSRILKEEQISIADTTPPEDLAHIILATNIAESSLTLPNVRYVIDFGLRRHMVYVPERNMECLMKTWISQASADQRQGRTGRVFEGTVIRLYTKYFFKQCMLKFDKPEMQVAALDKLVLQAKQVGRKVAEGMGPSDLLSLAISPPEVENVRDAIISLADAGALTAANEQAEMTMMALLVLHLPLDLALCRLIFFGTIFNCAADVVVMAAGLSLMQDVLSLPTPMVIKDPVKYRESLKWSFTTRSKFDGGEYSEPIMLVEMFKAWIKFRAGSIRQKQREDSKKTKQNSDSMKHNSHKASIEDPVDHAWNRFKKQFAVNEQRLIEMENAVTGIAARLARLVPPESDAAKGLKALMEAVSKVYKPVSGSHINERMSNLKVDQRDGAGYQDVWMFTEDTYVLKLVLAASFMPRFLCGVADGVVETKKGTANKGQKMLTDLEEADFTPERSVILNDTPAGVKRDPDLCKEVVGIMFAPQSLVKHKPLEDGRLFIEFTGWSGQSRHVLQDITWWAHAAYQFGEGRDHFPCPGLPHSQERGGPPKFAQPTHPYLLRWQYLDSSRINPGKMKGVPKGWRNPIGFACEKRSGVRHYAVAAEVQGGEDPKKCFVEGMTILPSDSDGLLAIAAMLTFLPGRFPLSITIESDNSFKDRIKAVDIIKHTMPISHKHPLQLDFLCRMNAVRREVSGILSRSLDEGTLPSTDLQPLLNRLVNYVLNGEQRKGLSGGESVTEAKADIFTPTSLSHAWSFDSLNSTDSEEDVSSRHEVINEDIPKDFTYLQEFDVEVWFPHAKSGDIEKCLLAETTEVQRLCPPKGAMVGDAAAEQPVFEDSWD